MTRQTSKPRQLKSIQAWLRRFLAGKFATTHDWFLPVNPVPASRPRVGRWGTYYSKTYATWRKEALDYAKAFEGVPTDLPVFVILEAIVAKPKTSKLSSPRGDVDNYAKAPLDTMTESGKFWQDDKQVVGLSITKRFARPDEEPGIKVTWYVYDSEGDLDDTG